MVNVKEKGRNKPRMKLRKIVQSKKVKNSTIVEKLTHFPLDKIVNSIRGSVYWKDENLNEITQENILSWLNQSFGKHESEFIYHLMCGLNAKQIGKNMGISYRTAEFYLNNAKIKLSCSTKSELIAKVFEMGLV